MSHHIGNVSMFRNKNPGCLHAIHHIIYRIINNILLQLVLLPHFFFSFVPLVMTETQSTLPTSPAATDAASASNPSASDDGIPRRRSTQFSASSRPQSSFSNLPNAIDLPDEEDNRLEIERIRTETLSRNPSLSSLPLASPESTRTSVRRGTRRHSIFTTTSQLSRPPSYKRFDPLDPAMSETEAADRSHLGGWHGLIAQFSGVYFAFWLVILGFLGAVSIIVPGIPQITLLLWIPLVLYLSFACYFFRKRRAARPAARRAAACEESYAGRGRRESRVRELLRAMRLPENYFFVISNPKEHTHPVVTLLPPPPTYNTSNSELPTVNEIPSGPSISSDNHHPDDGDYVRINLDRLVEAEHREQRLNSEL